MKNANELIAALQELTDEDRQQPVIQWCDSNPFEIGGLDVVAGRIDLVKGPAYTEPDTDPA